MRDGGETRACRTDRHRDRWLTIALSASLAALSPTDLDAQVEERRFAVIVASQGFEMAGDYFDDLTFPIKDLINLYDVLADPQLGAFTDIYPVVAEDELWSAARQWPELLPIVQDIAKRRQALDWAPEGRLEPLDCRQRPEACAPTRTNVLAFLEGVKKQADEGDEVLVYFSTHGTVLTPPDPNQPIPSRDMVLVMKDTQVEAGEEGLLTLLNTLTEADVLGVVNRMAAHQKALIEDTCHAAWPTTVEAYLKARGDTRGVVDIRQLTTSRQTVVISASGPSEFAYEDEALQNAVYTHFFVHALRSIGPRGHAQRLDAAGEAGQTLMALSRVADTDGDGHVSLEEARALVALVSRGRGPPAGDSVEGAAEFPSTLGSPFRLLVAIAAEPAQRLPLESAVTVLTAIDRDLDGAISLEEAHSFSAAATYVYTRLAKRGAQSPFRQDWRYRDPPPFIVSGQATFQDVAHLLPFSEDRWGQFDPQLMSSRGVHVVVDGVAFDVALRPQAVRPGLRQISIVDNTGTVLADARLYVRAGSTIRLQDIWALDQSKRAFWLGFGGAGWVDSPEVWSGAVTRMGFSRAVFSRTRDDWAVDVGVELTWGTDRGCWTGDPGCLVAKYTVNWMAGVDGLVQVRWNFPVAGVSSVALGVAGGPMRTVSSEHNIKKLMVGWGPRAALSWSPGARWWVRTTVDGRGVYGDPVGGGERADSRLHVMGQWTFGLERRY